MTEPAEQLPPPPPTPQQLARRENGLWAGLLLLLTLIVYQPALRGSFLWDDDRHVSQNRSLRSAEGLANIWLHPSTGRTLETGYVTPQYYPLTHTTYWLEYHLWGLDTTGYHLVNILLHAGSALLLWQLLKLLKLPGAWVAAAVFAVHPIEVESVAWITERKNVLSGLFFLASIYSYLRFVDPSDDTDRPSWPWYALALLFFTCAVFAKTVTSLMPVVVLILLYWRYRPRLSVKTLLPLLPMLLLGLVLSRQTSWMEKHVVGAIGPDWDLSFTQRLLVAGHAFWFYLGKLLLPFHLLFTYPRWNVVTPSPIAWLYVAAAAAVVVGSVAWLLLGTRCRAVPVAFLIYAALLFPASGFFDVYPMRFSFVADHFQYHAGIAFIVLVAAGLTSKLWRGERAPGAQVLQGLAGVVILLLAVLTWRQSSIYADPITLWTDTVTRNPGAWMAHYNLGTELARRAITERASGDPESAAKTFAAAATQFDQCVAIRPNHANAYANWGLVLYESGRYPEATAKLNRSIELDPASDEPHVTLGLLHMHTGDGAGAKAEFDRAISLDPKSFPAHLNLGHILAAEGNFPAAQASFERAEQIRPNDASTQFALATLLDRQLKFKDALPHALRAAQLAPDNADFLATLGYIWGENGRPRESYAAFQQALQIDPNNSRALEGAKTLIDAVGTMRRAATTRSTTAPSTRPATKAMK